MLEGKTILVVEDEQKIVDVIKAYLKSEKCKVIEAYDGNAATQMLNKETPDLIILDIMLPGIDGIQILKNIRTSSKIPVIMLSAKSEEVDRIIGLELGADDYVTKPFSPRELVARIKAVLRRKSANIIEDEKVIKAGPLTIDFYRHEVKSNDKVLQLTATEFDLLTALAKSQGRVFTRLQLIGMLQDFAYEGYERTIDAHIKNLRQKIEKNPSKPKLIKTVYGVGYKFEA